MGKSEKKMLMSRRKAEDARKRVVNKGVKVDGICWLIQC